MRDSLAEGPSVESRRLREQVGKLRKGHSNSPEASAQWLTQQTSQTLIDATTPSLLDRRVYFFDGTTVPDLPGYFSAGETLDAWRTIVSRAVADAQAGDARARDWVARQGRVT